MPELWRTVPGYGNYEVSTLGRVRNIKTGRVLRPTTSGSKRYPSAKLYQDGQSRTFKISILVAISHIGPRPEGMACCHRDDNSENNTLSNLYWGTRAQNVQDAHANRRFVSKPGTLNPASKLTEVEVLEIRQHCQNGVSQYVVAEKYGITQSAVSLIHRRKKWADIP